jgi:hypothetical protein
LYHILQKGRFFMKTLRTLALMAVVVLASASASFAHDGKKENCGDGGSCCSTSKKASAKASTKKAEKKDVAKATVKS